MTRRYNVLLLAMVIIKMRLCAGSGRGCGVLGATVGPTQTDTQTIEANGASSAQVELNLGAGELNVSSGARELAKAEFTYNIEGWKPTVDYNVNQGVGNLVITQPNTTAVLPQNIRYVGGVGAKCNDYD